VSGSPLLRELRAFLVESLARPVLADLRERPALAEVEASTPGGAKSLEPRRAEPWASHVFAAADFGGPPENQKVGEPHEA
jgi:hypothetical protein